VPRNTSSRVNHALLLRLDAVVSGDAYEAPARDDTRAHRRMLMARSLSEPKQ
jgi:hypothetical protein